MYLYVFCRPRKQIIHADLAGKSLQYSTVPNAEVTMTCQPTMRIQRFVYRESTHTVILKSELERSIA
jgi:hypothetical protein